MKHGIEKCRVCEHFISEQQGCTECKFEWSTVYPAVNDDEWDILDLDDELEWSFLQIQDRLRFKGIDCLLVLNWFDNNAVLLFGVRAFADRVADALGVHRECINEDSDYGVMVVNLFQEKYLRGEL